MDPLTHTLVGANLASTRLGTKTRFATAACVVGANAPDIDVGAYLLGEDFAIGFRRGWTHGLLALVLLPIVLWLILLLWDRARGGATNVHRGWLLALCVLSVLTHPFLDWLNVYGMRWLMPFDTTWFYGDSVFIMDPWLWLILASAWLAPRPPTRRLVMTWAVFTGLLALAVGGRAPLYLPVIAIVAILLLVALRWKPGEESRFRFAVIGTLAAAVYVAGMIGLHRLTERTVTARLAALGVEIVSMQVGPLPVDSLRWDVLVRTEDDRYRWGIWSWWSRELDLNGETLPVPDDSTLYQAAARDPSIAGFMSWVRYPWYQIENLENGTRVWILDARYTRSRRSGFGGVSVVVGDLGSRGEDRGARIEERRSRGEGRGARIGERGSRSEERGSGIRESSDRSDRIAGLIQSGTSLRCVPHSKDTLVLWTSRCATCPSFTKRRARDRCRSASGKGWPSVFRVEGTARCCSTSACSGI